MELDQLFRGFSVSQGDTGTMIACLYTGSRFPSCSAPMPRDPIPSVGFLLDGNFHKHVRHAIKINPSTHDGAIMIGRETTYEPYKITAWSFRLFAPSFSGHLPINRGSAFNSCYAIAQMSDVDCVYLHSAGQMHLFNQDGYRLIY